MRIKFFIHAVIRFLLGLIIVAILLFVPAGTVHYHQAWLLIAILFVPMFLAGIVMMIKCPDLLEKRLRMKEGQREQKLVIIMSGLMFVFSFVLAGLNFRLNWIVLPDFVSYMAAVIFLLSYLMYAEVLRENTYLSRTVELQENQEVIDTGLYGIVRHPMYTSTLFLFPSMALILGSIISFVIMLLYIPIIAIRIRNEEKVLEEGLLGYREYKNKVKYKVIPLIW